MRWPFLLVALTLAACVRRSAGDHDSNDDGAGDSDTTISGESDDVVGDADGDEAGGGECCDPQCPPVLEPPVSCDVWAQDCPACYKCRGIMREGATILGACRPAGPHGIGEPCDAPNSTSEMGDGCDVDGVCHDPSPGADAGVCVHHCGGTGVAPTCPGPEGDTSCLPLAHPSCVPTCDPLDPNACPPGLRCIFNASPTTPGFVCFQPADDGTAGQWCGCANCCAERLLCVGAEEYGPGCVDENACCTELCDVADADFECAEQDQVCVPIFDADHPAASIGRCITPTP